MTHLHPLIIRAQHEGSPLIDGDQVTFVWHGPAPAPRLIGDFNDWADDGQHLIELDQVSNQVWTHTQTFDRDAYLEYAYVDARDREQRVPDPFNARTIWNGVNADNHFFHMPDAQRDVPETQRPRGTARGRVTRLTLAGQHVSWLLVGGQRYVRLYQPPVAEPVPLLIVLDGSDFYKRASIVPIVDTLIASKRIRPIALALVDNSPTGRFIEYSASESTLLLLGREIIRIAAEHIPLIDARSTPGVHGVAGASLGGLMALYTGLRVPSIFGHVISHSGAFSVIPEHPFVVFDLAKYAPLPALKLWMDCGKYEGLLQANRQMKAVLQARGLDFTYHEYSGGHNYTCWRMMLPRALETVYGT